MPPPSLFTSRTVSDEAVTAQRPEAVQVVEEREVADQQHHRPASRRRRARRRRDDAVDARSRRACRRCARRARAPGRTPPCRAPASSCRRRASRRPAAPRRARSARAPRTARRWRRPLRAARRAQPRSPRSTARARQRRAASNAQPTAAVIALSRTARRRHAPSCPRVRVRVAPAASLVHDDLVQARARREAAPAERREVGAAPKRSTTSGAAAEANRALRSSGSYASMTWSSACRPARTPDSGSASTGQPSTAASARDRVGGQCRTARGRSTIRPRRPTTARREAPPRSRGIGASGAEAGTSMASTAGSSGNARRRSMSGSRNGKLRCTGPAGASMARLAARAAAYAPERSSASLPSAIGISKHALRVRAVQPAPGRSSGSRRRRAARAGGRP